MYFNPFFNQVTLLRVWRISKPSNKSFQTVNLVFYGITLEKLDGNRLTDLGYDKRSRHLTMAVHLLYLSQIRGGRLSAPKDLPFDLGTSESTTVPCLFDIPFEPSHVRSSYIVANGEYEIQFFHFNS